jgi:hypothetical protein
LKHYELLKKKQKMLKLKLKKMVLMEKILKMLKLLQKKMQKLLHEM